MTSTNEIFAANLRAEIARKQLISSDLVDVLHKPKSSVYRLIRGEQIWSLTDATYAAEWVGVSLTKLFKEGESA